MKLHRTTLNLYAEDVEFLERYHGYGWTEIVRDEIHKRVGELREIFECAALSDEEIISVLQDMRP